MQSPYPIKNFNQNNKEYFRLSKMYFTKYYSNFCECEDFDNISASVSSYHSHSSDNNYYCDSETYDEEHENEKWDYMSDCSQWEREQYEQEYHADFGSCDSYSSCISNWDEPVKIQLYDTEENWD